MRSLSSQIVSYDPNKTPRSHGNQIARQHYILSRDKMKADFGHVNILGYFRLARHRFDFPFMAVLAILVIFLCTTIADQNAKYQE